MKKTTTKKTEPAQPPGKYRLSNDPKQQKLLTKVRKYLDDAGSRYRVNPNFEVIGELADLKMYEARCLAWAKALRGGIEMIEASPVYKRLKPTVEAKDAFKFT
jgi:hypothetical protein